MLVHQRVNFTFYMVFTSLDSLDWPPEKEKNPVQPPYDKNGYIGVQMISKNASWFHSP